MMRKTKAMYHCLAAGILAILIGSAAGCGVYAHSAGRGAPMNVITREDGSGTRTAFVELFGIEGKNADGKKTDRTMPGAQVTNNTAVMMMSVAGDENCIGYISLGSLNQTVKALAIDGVAPSMESIADGSYKITRPFHLIYKSNTGGAVRAFISYITSSEGAKIVEDSGYIPPGNTKPYAGAPVSGKVVVAGSSSVTPVMEKLAEAYKKVNGNVSVEVQLSDSTTGIASVASGLSDIGMASRELTTQEKHSDETVSVMATDGIAVIVNKDNPVSALSADQIKRIYTGAVTSWSEVEV